MPTTSPARKRKSAVVTKPAPFALPFQVPDILALMDDPALCGPFFVGESWTPWRTFLRALFALPMDDADLETFREYTKRTTAITTPFVEAGLVIGRRGGKSRIMALIAVFLALKDYSPYLAPGEVATLAVIAADKSQAKTIVRYIVGMLEGAPSLACLIAEQTAETVTLTNRVHIAIGVASLRSTRGFSYCAVLADECCFWRNEDTSANPDTEVLQAIRPGLSNIPGALLLLASSPYAKRGVLYETWRDNFGRDDADVLVWQASTLAMHPTINRRQITREYEKDPANAAAEFGAQWRDDISAFVSLDMVEAVIDSGVDERPPMAGVTYQAFVDPSGGRSDSMCIAIAHADGDVGVLDVLREITPPFSPEDAVAEFAELLLAYGVRTVVGDRFGAEWTAERFRTRLITYEQSAKPKSDLYRELLPILTAGRCRLLDHPRLTSQLVSLERRTARGGRDRIDHPRGLHDDAANVCAGVMVMVTGEEDTNAIWAKVGAGYADGSLVGWSLPRQ